MDQTARTLYQDFRHRLDDQLAKATEKYQEHLACKAGCFGCCKRDFQISVVEAASLMDAVANLSPNQKATIQRQINDKTRPYCPLLIEGQCSVYAERPLLCRVFGLPVMDGDHLHTCELNFTEYQGGEFTTESIDGAALRQAVVTLQGLWQSEHPTSFLPQQGHIETYLETSQILST